MLKIGLTGTLASGKSTTAQMFSDMGVPVFGADAAVHELYRGRATKMISSAFPDAVINGAVDRATLARLVRGDRTSLARLEAIVHPLVEEEEARFIADAARDGHRTTVSDIPLLFETGADRRYDVLVVVTASEETRRARALARPGMTAALYETLSARQMLDEEKRRRAHFIIDSGQGLEAARAAVADVLRAVAPMADLR